MSNTYSTNYIGDRGDDARFGVKVATAPTTTTTTVYDAHTTHRHT